jgi:hypothetical protein
LLEVEEAPLVLKVPVPVALEDIAHLLAENPLAAVHQQKQR